MSDGIFDRPLYDEVPFNGDAGSGSGYEPGDVPTPEPYPGSARLDEAMASSSGDTDVVLVTGSGDSLPITYPYLILIGSEIMTVTSRISDTLTVTRGAADSTVAAHPAGALVTVYSHTDEVEAEPAQYTERYTLEVQNDTGAVQTYLPDALQAKWAQAINEPSIMTFTYPQTSDAVDKIVAPNVIVLRDSSNAILDKFIVAQTSAKREADGRLSLNVHAEGYLSILGRVVVEDYEADGENVNAVINYLLDLQPDDLPWAKVQLGSVHETYGSQSVSMKVENKTVLQALRQLRGIIGGYFKVEVTAAGTPLLHWDVLRTSLNAPRQIAGNRNSPWMTVTQDWRTVRTKVIAYGAQITTGTGEEAVTERLRSEVTSDAAKIAEYGTTTAIYTESSITSQDTLDDFAAARLAERESPRTEYYIGAIELNNADTSWDYADEPLNLGDGVRVVDTDLGIQLGTAITKVTRVLGGNTNVEHGDSWVEGYEDTGAVVELADPNSALDGVGYPGNLNKPRDIFDEIIDLKERVDDLDDSIADVDIDPADIDPAEIDWSEFDIGEFPWDIPDWDEIDFPWEGFVQEQIEAANVPTPGDNIQSVGSANSGGTSSRYAREDHVHEGDGGGAGGGAIWLPFIEPF